MRAMPVGNPSSTVVTSNPADPGMGRNMGMGTLDKDKVVPLYYLPIMFILAGLSLLAYDP